MQVEAWLKRAARLAPTLTALETPDARLSYAQLARAARAGACELADRGVRPGERVGIALAPGVAFAQAFHACLLLGAPAVPVDLRLTPAERARMLRGTSVLVEEPLRSPPDGEGSGRDGEGSGRDGKGSGKDREGWGKDGVCSGTDGEGADRFEDAVHDLDAVCAVIHTSGTTSAPRPVELTYGNFLWSALGSGVALGVEERERWLCALPLAHVGGLSILVRSAIYATTAVIHERFRTDSAIAALREGRITLVSLVSTTLARLLDAGLRDPPRLRCALTGGGPVPAALVQRAREAGIPVLATYGLTECCSQAATSPLALLDGQPAATDALGRSGAGEPWEQGSGTPLFCARVSVGGDGEIMVGGPTVAPASLGPDGWLRTGDLGDLDAHGFLHVTGRKADTIVSGGENVAPVEVEAVLESCPGVIEAAVVGREDPRWGEAVTAIVVVAPGARVRESDLRGHCASHLAPFKIPKRLELVSAPLPRTRSGKLLRREL